MTELEQNTDEAAKFDCPKTRVLPPLGRIPAAELKLWIRAADAVEEIDALCVETQARAEDHYKAERKRGYDAGYAAGARDVAKVHLETQAAADAYLDRLKETLPEIIDEILHKIIGSFEGHELMRKAITHALAQQSGSLGVSIRVPEQFVQYMCEQVAPEERLELDRVPIEIDQSLEAGKCVMESEVGMVNLGIEDQLSLVRDYIKQHATAVCSHV